MINQWYGLDLLLDKLDQLDETMDKKYNIRNELIPAWKNFLKNRADNFNRHPEMVDHGTVHVSNVIGLLAEWVIPGYEKIEKKSKNNKENNGDTDSKILNAENKLNNNKENNGDASSKILNAEELFLLISGIFMHDIGMSYLDDKNLNKDLVKKSDIVRKKHGFYSDEMLKDKEYIELVRGLDNEVIKCIGLISEHHQKNALIFSSDLDILLNMKQKELNEDEKLDEINRKKKFDEEKANLEKRIPLEIKIKNDHAINKYLTDKGVNILLLACIIRVLDAADNQYSRAGSIWLSKLKKQKNEINKSEHEFIKDQIALDKKDVIDYYEKRINYFKDQHKHYIKHSFFEKSWIIDNEIIFKPLDIDQFEELCQIENDLKNDSYKNQVKKYLKIVTDYIDDELKLVNSYLKENRNFWHIKSIIEFEKDKHYNKIKKLKYFSDYITVEDYYDENYIFKNGDVGYDLRNKIINGLAAKDKKTVYVVGPAKSSKTYMLSSVCNELSKNEKFDGIIIFKITRKSTNFIKSFIKSVSAFLADHCNFWFFNRLRTANEVEKTTWDKFFRQLEKGKYLICFDDFNKLPNLNKKTYDYEFLNEMFSVLNNTKFLIFTTQLPTNYYDESKSIVYKMNFDELKNDSTAEQFINDSKKKLFIDNKFIKNNPALKNSLIDLIKKYYSFPAVIYTRFKEEMKYYNNNDFFSASNFDTGEMIGFIDKMIARQLHREVYESLGDDYQKKIIKHLAKSGVSDNVNIDKFAIAKNCFNKTELDEKTGDRIISAIESLKLRSILYQKDGEKNWRIDEWWKAIL